MKTCEINSFMQIFYLHSSPKKCAKMHADKHVVKCILETTQLLCSAHYMTGSSYKPPYKLTHKNHPCAIWARESVENYKWLIQLGLELAKEYTFRYERTHKCEQYILELEKNIPPIFRLEFTLPAQAMPDVYKDVNTVHAYRAYYFFDKFHLLKWKKRNCPKWITKMYEIFS